VALSANDQQIARPGLAHCLANGFSAVWNTPEGFTFHAASFSGCLSHILEDKIQRLRARVFRCQKGQIC
jgi:hypothetical protein